MSSEESTTVKVPVFDGEEKSYQTWITRFQAFARVKGFISVLEDASITINEEDVEDLEMKPKYGSGATGARTRDEEKQFRLGKKNLLAMAHLTMAFGSEGLLNKIPSSCTSDWPGGLAFKMMDTLKVRYAPKDRMTIVERTRKLNKVTLSARENPANLFEEIKAIDNQYKMLAHDLTEDDKIAAVLEKAPNEYAVILANTAREKGSALTLDDLEEAMRIQWRIEHGDEDESKKKSKEFSLSAFGGKCYNCGKTGHRASNCPEKDNNNRNSGQGSGGKKKFNGTCNTCGKQGHKAEDCWDDERNAHKRPRWYKPKTEKSLGAVNNSSGGGGSEFLLMGLNKMEFRADARILDDPNVFIGDTGASSDTTASKLGFQNTRPGDAKDNIVDASGNDLSGKLVGDVSGTFCNKNGEELFDATIKEMVHTPNAGYNLFSITKRLEHGYKLRGDKNSIWIEKGEHKIVFDIKIKTPKGAIFAAYFKQRVNDESEVAAVMTDRQRKLNADTVHGWLGHMNDADGRKTIKHLGFEITRKGLTPCAACAEAKAKQKSLPSRTEIVRVEVNPKEVARKVNERIHLDISSVKAPKDLQVNVTKPNWRIMVDERTGMKWSDFYEAKSDMVEPTCEEFYQWKLAGKPVQFVRGDNAGENKKLKERLKSADWKLSVDFEWTARATPQQNSLAEVGFTTIGNRGRAMMIAANIPYPLRFKLFKEAYACATLLDRLVLVTLDGETKTRVEHWSGKLPNWTKALRTWGEAGVATVNSKTRPKLKNKGITSMFVGYAVNHADGVYRMWNPNTGLLLVSRDVTWLKRMFYRRQPTLPEISVGIENELAREVRESDCVTTNTTPTVNSNELKANDEPNNLIEPVTPETPSEVNSTLDSYRSLGALVESDGDTDDDDDTDDSDESEAEETENEGLQTVTRSGRVSQPPGWLRDYAALALTKEEAGYQANLMNIAKMEFGEEDVKIDHELAGVGAGVGGGFSNTGELKVMKYEEAMKKDAEGWGKAVDEEHGRMITNRVWRPVKRDEVPKGAKVLTSTWACKLKANGTKRARINGRGYEQVDGVHYDGSSIHAPVTNDASVRIVMILALMAGWIGWISDVKGAFLKGDLDLDKEVMFLKVPKGFEKFYPSNVLLQLLKALYGTKQAAAAFWKELLKCMRDMMYKRNGADPCMYFKWTMVGLVIWLSWVDDCMIWGHKDIVPKENEEFMSRFDCDDVGEVKEYVGCKIDRNEKERSIKFTQPVMIQSFKDEFKTGDRKPTTPAEGGSVLMKGDENTVVGSSDHTYFRSGLGKLLHMTRWSRPEVQNSVRELARQGSAPTGAHLKAMHRSMEYCRGTPNRGWKLKPERAWNGVNKDFEFRITGMSDSDYAKCPTTRRSVSGYTTFLEGAPVTVKSAMQKVVALSVTEAETIAGVQCVQDMLYIKKILEAMELKVELPMVLRIDNSGAVDLANSWSAGGRTRHMDTRMFFLRELKEAGILKIVWIKGDDNPADMFTKNLGGPAFNKHAKVFVGEDEYNQKKVTISE